VVSHHKVARDAAEAGLMRLLRMMSILFPCLALAQVLVNADDYRFPVLAVAVWLAALGAGAWLVPKFRSGALPATETAAAIAVAVAAVATTGALYRAQSTLGNVDLAVLGTIWLLVLVALSHSTLVLVPAALLVFAAQAAMLIRHYGLKPLDLSQLEAAGYIIAAVLIAFAVLRPTLDTHVRMAARRASLASRSAAERAAAVAIQQERRGRLAVLEKDAIPLLRGIADGTLDPAAPDVRGKCARHAEALRRSLSGSPGASELIAVLQPTLQAAAARDLPVNVQVIGDWTTPRCPGDGGRRDQRASTGRGSAHGAGFRR
jgi:hypothetical protein